MDNVDVLQAIIYQVQHAYLAMRIALPVITQLKWTVFHADQMPTSKVSLVHATAALHLAVAPCAAGNAELVKDKDSSTVLLATIMRVWIHSLRSAIAMTAFSLIQMYFNVLPVTPPASPALVQIQRAAYPVQKTPIYLALRAHAKIVIS